jgi:hypothetical protein
VRGLVRGGLVVWKTTLHANGVEVDRPLRSSIERQVRRALGGLEKRVGHVHVRLYGDVEGTGLHTCYIRVDAVPSGGIALGDTSADLEDAVARTVSRIGAAVGREVEKGQWPGSGAATTSAYGFVR